MTKRTVVKQCVAAVSLALLSGVASANSFNLGLSNETIELGLSIPFSSSAQISADYMKTEDQGKIYQLGFQTVQYVAKHSVSLGGKFVYLNSDRRDDGRAFALGGGYSRGLAPQVSMAVSAYYAPSVLSSSGVDRHYQLDGKLMYEVMPTADVYAGYRDIKFKFDNQPDQTLEQGFYIGASLKF